MQRYAFLKVANSKVQDVSGFRSAGHKILQTNTSVALLFGLLNMPTVA